MIEFMSFQQMLWNAIGKAKEYSGREEISFSIINDNLYVEGTNIGVFFKMDFSQRGWEEILSKCIPEYHGIRADVELVYVLAETICLKALGMEYSEYTMKLINPIINPEEMIIV